MHQLNVIRKLLNRYFGILIILAHWASHYDRIILSLSLHCFTEVDLVDDCDDRNSTWAYIVYLGANPISWSYPRQRSIAHPSIEAEYRAIADVATEVQWTKYVLSELHVPISATPVVHSDNIIYTYVFLNHVFHSKMKHIAIYCHFI